jgi:hypothetical protein
MTLTESPDFDAAVLRFLLKMLKFLCVLITIGAIAAGQDVAIPQARCFAITRTGKN